MTENTDLNLNELNSPAFDEAGGDLDALFTSAREHQPGLVDENFTKVVVNSLPARAVRRRKAGFSFDLIGAVIGLVLAYFLFDVRKVVGGVLNLIPETLVLSPVHMLVALAFVSGMSLLAWWVVENGRA